MITTRKTVASAILIGILSIAAAGQSTGGSSGTVSAEGEWTGKIVIQLPAVKDQDVKTKASMEDSLSTVRKISIDLRLNPDKSFVWTYSGLPQNANSVKPNTTISGSWAQSGTTVTVVSKQKGATKLPAITLSSDGRRMSMPLPTSGNAQIVFTPATKN